MLAFGPFVGELAVENAAEVHHLDVSGSSAVKTPASVVPVFAAHIDGSGPWRDEVIRYG